jgi:ribose/xylose/arabinose/galactoside ABC-type transport system permease subunit
MAGGVLAWIVPLVLLGLSVGLVLSQLKRPTAIFGLWGQWAEIAIVALGMTAVILSGGVDLSVGSIVPLASVVLGLLWRDAHAPLLLACIGAVAVGVVAGALNGGLVVAGIPPLVATLGTTTLYAGIAMTLVQGNRIAMPPAFTEWGNSSWLGLPVQVYGLLAAAAPVWLFVHGSRWGRCLFAIGDNRRAATMAALPVAAVEWSLYALVGLLAGLSAVFYTARGGASPDPIPEWTLDAISCVILGGTRVTGGRGGVGRTLLGAAILAHLQIGLRLASSRDLYWPWSDQPWRLTADARLIVVGFAVIVVAAWNERVAARREG